MKTKHLFILGISLLLSHGVLAQGTAFTYQGRLNWNGQPAHGLYDFSFSGMDAETGGAIINARMVANGVAVANGLFTVTLNPGSGVFTGPSRWLSTLVKTNCGALFEVLSPHSWKWTGLPNSSICIWAKPNITYLAADYRVSRRTILRDLHDLIQRGQLDAKVYPVLSAEETDPDR